MRFQVTGRRLSQQEARKQLLKQGQAPALDTFARRVCTCHKCDYYNEAFEVCNTTRLCVRVMARQGQCPKGAF